MKPKLKSVLALFFSFFKIGLFTFGGGYAMIPLIQKEAVSKQGWITDDDILEILAIAESTPGPIAINSATFVGYRVAGFFGALAATIGVVVPSFVIILLLSYAFTNFQENRYVKAAFFGIRAGVLGLLFKSLFTMYQKLKKSLLSYILLAAAFTATAFFNVHVLVVVLGCASCGIVSALLARKKVGK